MNEMFMEKTPQNWIRHGKSILQTLPLPLRPSLLSAPECSGNAQKRNEKKVKVNGNVIAHGHPIGATGARIVMTLAYELRRRGGESVFAVSVPAMLRAMLC
jgi:hypothetical protein